MQGMGLPLAQKRALMQKVLQRILHVLRLGQKIQQLRLPEAFQGSCRTRHGHQLSLPTCKGTFYHDDPPCLG